MEQKFIDVVVVGLILSLTIFPSILSTVYAVIQQQITSRFRINLTLVAIIIFTIFAGVSFYFGFVVGAIALVVKEYCILGTRALLTQLHLPQGTFVKFYAIQLLQSFLVIFMVTWVTK